MIKIHLDHENLPLSPTINHDYPPQWSRQLHWRRRRFYHYYSWLQREHKGTNIQISTTQIRNEQINGGSNSHMFTDINILTYIGPVKWNIQIRNGRKAPIKCFWTCYHKKWQKKHHYSTTAIIIYSQTPKKHYELLFLVPDGTYFHLEPSHAVHKRLRKDWNLS